MINQTLLLYVPNEGLSLIELIIVLAIFIAIFLALRNVMLWYWKVNAIVKNQETIIELLRKIGDKNNML